MAVLGLPRGGVPVAAEVAEALGAPLDVIVVRKLGHAHLTHLAEPKQRKKPTLRAQQVRGPLRTLLGTMDGVPAVLVGRRSDILAWNRMTAAVFGDWAELPAQERNWARLVFLHPEYRDLFVDWEEKANDVVSLLRMDAGSHPDDPRLSALVGELSVKSEEFRQLWATHDVKERCHGVQRLRHPLVGELDLRLASFHLADDHEQMLVTYHAEPNSPSAEAPRLLACWGTDATRAGTGTLSARRAR